MGIIFMLDKFLGNESFRTDIESPFLVFSVFFSNCYKKLLKPLAISVESFNFPLVSSKVGTCST